MLERGFLQHNKEEKNWHHKIASTASKILLYVGLLIIAGSFGYLVLNPGKTDALIVMLVPFLIAGLGFILVSQLIKRGYKKLR